jgi:hypothetical protein
LPSEDELQAAKLEHKKAKKSEDQKRLSVSNNIKQDGNSSNEDDKATSNEKGAATTTTTTTKKPAKTPPPPPQQAPKNETTSEKAGKTMTKKKAKQSQPPPPPDENETDNESAALDKAHYPNGKLFNPKEYLLLEKAFNNSLSEKDAKDNGETVLKKDIKAATALFRDMEQEGKVTNSASATKSLSSTTTGTATNVEKKVPPSESKVQATQVALADKADDDEPIVDAVSSPGPQSNKKNDPSSSVKKSSKKKKKKKDKKHKRERESMDSHGQEDRRNHMKHSQDTLSE